MFKYKKALDSISLREIVAQYNDAFLTELQILSHAIGPEILFLGAKDGNDVSTFISLRCGEKIDNITYKLKGSPCEHVLNEDVCVYPSGLLSLFPNDQVLQSIQLDSYMGASLKNELGERVGILVALFSENEAFSQRQKIFSAYARNIENLFQRYHQEMRSTSLLNLMQEVQSLSKIGAWEYHIEADNVYWSEEIYDIYALPKGKSISLSEAMSYYTPYSQQVLGIAFDNLLQSAKPFSLELEFEDARGNRKWVKASGNSEADSTGGIVRVFGAFEDITTETLLKIQTEERAQKIENILDSINDALITIDHRGEVTHFNKIALDMFGYSPSELFGANVSMLMPAPYAQQHDMYMKHYEQTGNAKIMGVGRQLPARRKSGEIFQMELSLSELQEDGEKVYIGVVRDISERISAQDTIYNLAFTDNVTQLRNSQWFEREIKNLSHEARRDKQGLFVLLLDIDKMGAFNRKFGFEAGDNALKQIATKTKQAVGSHLSVYKYDADAFIFVSKSTYPITGVHQFDVKMIKELVLDVENFQVKTPNGDETLSASVGSVIFDPSKHSFESMLNILEHAVEEAKATAPFGSCHIPQAGIEQYDRLVNIKSALDGVAERGELSLAFQPQYGRNAEVVGFEALVRWHSDSLGYVSPAEFIPLAEESSAIISIGDWVLREAMLALSQSTKLGLNCSMSVNISAKQIVDPSFVDKLLACLSQHNIPPQSIILELTETALVIDISVVKQVMSTLTGYGIRFSIDDFGTGYSSLSYLKELPISEVKIDKYFVDDIDECKPNRVFKIVDAIINISQALGVNCVAEGVEYEIQRDYLQGKGCQVFQGYYFSKPLGKEEWLALLMTLSQRGKEDIA